MQEEYFIVLVMANKFIDKPFYYHEELVVTIRGLTNEGRGIADVDGWVIMVPFVIVGEVVRVRIFKNNKNYSEADLVEVIKASADRVQPKCKLFGKCGGCQYQHINYGRQLELKRQHVQDCFDRIAKVEVNVASVVASESDYFYRTKLTPHFERTKAGELPIGFLSYGKRRELVDVDRCEIASERINDALGAEREKVLMSNCKRSGTLLLRDSVAGVITNNNALAESDAGGFRFKFPAGSFFQNNPSILNSIIEHIQKIIDDAGCIDNIVDTYCGVGVFCIALANRVKSFIGIEIDERAVELASENTALNGVENGDIVLGDADSVFSLARVGGERTMLIMDPPRKGATEYFLQQLGEFAPNTIVYISCAPDTQARDIGRFLAINSAYKIVSVTPFDMFPQTKHIESVVVLSR